jgi:uncharacterized membrane protein
MIQQGVHPSRGRTALVLVGWALTAGIALAALQMPPDGNEHRALWQFIGRFHPLLVHAPIAFLVLVPLLETAGAGRNGAHLRATAGFVLMLAAFAAIAAAADGWMLAWSGGYSRRIVMRHMWGGVALAGACVLAVWARGCGSPPVRRFGYPLLLAGTIVLMTWTAHQGGTLTQGEGFLTDKVPARLRAWFGLPPPAVRARRSDHAVKPAKPAAGATARVPIPFTPGAPVSYATIVPLLERSCISCHRPAKHKGGLRMDSYALLMQGGEDGPVVAPGDPGGSELIRRVTLPRDDDDYMPSDGKKPLSPGEIVLIERWIAGGANGG